MTIEAALSLRKGDFELEVEFQVPGQGVTAIFGPSGCGKTTLLRAIAGLEKGAQGSLRVNDTVWQSEDCGTRLRRKQKSLPTHERRLGYVFQEPGLFPHLSVRGNLEYGLRRADGRAAITIEEVGELLGLGSLTDRHPETLSGGEKQRIAIGRALLSSPDLLLMDEPLAALDIRSRQEILPFLEGLTRQLRIPVLYVSHSPDEVAYLAEHMVLLEAGRVAACGPMAEVLGRIDSPLARSSDAFSVITCQVMMEQRDFHLTRLRTRGGELIRIPAPCAATAGRSGSGSPDADRSDSGPHAAGGALEITQEKVRLRIQARDVSVCLQKPEGSSILNILPARIVELFPAGEAGQQMLKLDVAGDFLLSRLSDYSCQELGLRPGLDLYAQIKAAALI